MTNADQILSRQHSMVLENLSLQEHRFEFVRPCSSSLQALPWRWRLLCRLQDLLSWWR